MRFVFAFLFFPVSSFCQMSIDAIKNDEDAVKFVESYNRKYNMHWEKVGVDILDVVSMRSFREEDKKYIDSLTKNKWIKSDFNNDGKTDLIFSGKINNSFATLSFISQKGDSISCDQPGSILSIEYPSGIRTYQLNNLNLLLINSLNRNEFEFNIRKSYRQDTLIYKFGGFAEYNTKADEKLDFDSIVYINISNWVGVIQVPKIVISSTGTIKLYRDKYASNIDSAGWTNNMYKSIADCETIESLRAILGYINFPNLRSEYALNYITDLSTAETEVYYKGTVKRISDYGMHGTYGLSLLYKIFQGIKMKSLSKQK